MDVLNLPRPAWMTEDVVLLEEQARRFIASEYVPHFDEWDEAGIYDREVWTKAGAAGLLCAAMPEQYGGAGGSFAHEAVIIQELVHAGFDSFGGPLHSGIVAPYILHYGTEEQKQRWLPKLASGEMVGAIAMTEPGTGSDLQGVKTTAKKSGNGYLLNPRVSVEVLSYRPIYILGEVNKPGEYDYVPGMTVLAAIAKAEGFTYRAQEKSIFLKRQGSDREVEIRLHSDTPIHPGDTLRIGERYF